MRSLSTIHTNDYELSRIQSNVLQFARQFRNSPIIDGKLIEDVSLSTTPVTVTHSLGRPVRGWMIVRSNANAVVYESSSANPAPNSALYLVSSATVTVSLWVF